MFTYDGHAHGAVASSVTGADGLSTTASAFTHYAGDVSHLPSDSDPATLTVIARSPNPFLAGSTQSALNISKERSVDFKLDISAASIVYGKTIAICSTGPSSR